MGQSIQQAYDRLQTQQRSSISVGPFEVTAARSADRTELYLITSVFNGGSYLPGSVRAAVSGAGLIATGNGRRAMLVIDEAKFEVRLHYQLDSAPHDAGEFVVLFEEFLAVADEWRTLLNEHGQQDLVWVPRA